MITAKDVKKVVAQHVKDLVGKLTPDTMQDDVIEAIGAATETAFRGWFLPLRVDGWKQVDPQRHCQACLTVLHTSPSWCDYVLYDSMLPHEMQQAAWESLRASIYQALADLGYDLHAEYPLAKVIHGPLTGHRMTAEYFGNLCEAAYEADPIRDLVHELMRWGLSETQLMNLLKTQGVLPTPFKIAVQNKFRDLRLTSSE